MYASRRTPYVHVCVRALYEFGNVWCVPHVSLRASGTLLLSLSESTARWSRVFLENILRLQVYIILSVVRFHMLRFVLLAIMLYTTSAFRSLVRPGLRAFSKSTVSMKNPSVSWLLKLFVYFKSRSNTSYIYFQSLFLGIFRY